MSKVAKASLFECADLRFHYRLGNQEVTALDRVTLAIDRGGVVCLSGPSGSGKSTLLNLLGLIEPVQAGQLLFKGQDIGQLSERDKCRIRRHNLGFIFQNFQLIEVLRADENVEYFLARQGIAGPKRRAMVEEALRAVGLWKHRSKRPPQMSGGQRQRVAIARALVKRPDVIIADEPTASLDQTTGREVMRLMKVLAEQHGVTVVMSSHDPMVLDYTSDVIHLVDGRVVTPKNEDAGHAV